VLFSIGRNKAEPAQEQVNEHEWKEIRHLISAMADSVCRRDCKKFKGAIHAGGGTTNK